MNFVVGGLASVTAELFTFPVDMAKTRLQLQGQAMDSGLKNIKYRGMLHTITLVAKEEGLRTLYRGVSAAFLRQATYGTIKIGLYEYLKGQSHKLFNQKDNSNLFINIFNGVVSGGVATMICSPTDMLKIRFQAQASSTGMQNKNVSLLKSFRTIYRDEGFLGMYRGVLPNTYRAAVVTGVELGVYDYIKSIILKINLLEDGPPAHLLASAVAGVFGAVCSNPFDVLKSRMMNQLNTKDSNPGNVYRSTFHCFSVLLKTEGFFALYKGLVAGACRLVPWNIIFFMSLEQYRRLFGYYS